VSPEELTKSNGKFQIENHENQKPDYLSSCLSFTLYKELAEVTRRCPGNGKQNLLIILVEVE
jgi:hypothetical protein